MCKQYRPFRRSTPWPGRQCCHLCHGRLAPARVLGYAELVDRVLREEARAVLEGYRARGGMIYNA